MLNPTTIFVLALSATAAIATPVSPAAGDPIDFTAAIIGTFNGGTCSSNQQDWSDSVDLFRGSGTCHELPGSSMKIWWVKKGCLGKCCPFTKLAIIVHIFKR
jgi:hypothetical protein